MSLGAGAVLSADIAVPGHEREVRFYSRVLSTGEGIRNTLKSGALFARAWNMGGANRYPRLLRETLPPGSLAG